MVLKCTNKTNFILLDGFARVCTVSANFPDNPRTCIDKRIIYLFGSMTPIQNEKYVCFLSAE